MAAFGNYHNDFLFVRSGHRWVKIFIAEISYLEGMKDYTIIYLRNKDHGIPTLINLKTINEKLQPHFIRIHRSYIVSVNHIDFIQKKEVYIGKKIIPVGEAYWDALQSYLRRNFL